MLSYSAARRVTLPVLASVRRAIHVSSARAAKPAAVQIPWGLTPRFRRALPPQLVAGLIVPVFQGLLNRPTWQRNDVLRTSRVIADSRECPRDAVIANALFQTFGEANAASDEKGGAPSNVKAANEPDFGILPRDPALSDSSIPAGRALELQHAAEVRFKYYQHFLRGATDVFSILFERGLPGVHTPSAAESKPAAPAGGSGNATEPASPNAGDSEWSPPDRETLESLLHPHILSTLAGMRAKLAAAAPAAAAGSAPFTGVRVTRVLSARVVDSLFVWDGTATEGDAEHRQRFVADARGHSVALTSTNAGGLFMDVVQKFSHFHQLRPPRRVVGQVTVAFVCEEEQQLIAGAAAPGGVAAVGAAAFVPVGTPMRWPPPQPLEAAAGFPAVAGAAAIAAASSPSIGGGDAAKAPTAAAGPLPLPSSLSAALGSDKAGAATRAMSSGPGSSSSSFLRLVLGPRHVSHLPPSLVTQLGLSLHCASGPDALADAEAAAGAAAGAQKPPLPLPSWGWDGAAGVAAAPPPPSAVAAPALALATIPPAATSRVAAASGDGDEPSAVGPGRAAPAATGAEVAAAAAATAVPAPAASAAVAAEAPSTDLATAASSSSGPHKEEEVAASDLAAGSPAPPALPLPPSRPVTVHTLTFEATIRNAREPQRWRALRYLQPPRMTVERGWRVVDIDGHFCEAGTGRPLPAGASAFVVAAPEEDEAAAGAAGEGSQSPPLPRRNSAAAAASCGVLTDSPLVPSALAAAPASTAWHAEEHAAVWDGRGAPLASVARDAEAACLALCRLQALLLLTAAPHPQRQHPSAPYAAAAGPAAAAAVGGAAAAAEVSTQTAELAAAAAAFAAAAASGAAIAPGVDTRTRPLQLGEVAAVLAHCRAFADEIATAGSHPQWARALRLEERLEGRVLEAEVAAAAAAGTSAAAATAAAVPSPLPSPRNAPFSAGAGVVCGRAVLEPHADHATLTRLTGRLHPSAARVANLMAPSASSGNGPYDGLYLLNVANALMVWGLPAAFESLRLLRRQLQAHVEKAAAASEAPAVADDPASEPSAALPAAAAAAAGPPPHGALTPAAALASARAALAALAEAESPDDTDADAHADASNAYAGVLFDTGAEAVQGLQAGRRARLGRLVDHVRALEAAARGLRNAGLLLGFAFDAWSGSGDGDAGGGDDNDSGGKSGDDSDAEDGRKWQTPERSRARRGGKSSKRRTLR